jgi:DNA-binding NarL/FixJ family response regulator
MNRVSRQVGVGQAGAKVRLALRPSAAVHKNSTIIFIDHVALTRECIAKELAVLLPECALEVICAPAAQATDARRFGQPRCVVYHSHSLPIEDPQVVCDIGLIQDFVRGVPIALLSDIEATENVVSTMRRGIAGYIPTSLPLKIVSEAIRLVLCGGTFIPASALPITNNSERPHSSNGAVPAPISNTFTPRQKDVLRHLWEGRSNKSIAYALRMSEGTVKVHIKHIMKRVQADNRTQAVLITRQMLMPDAGVPLPANAIPGTERMRDASSAASGKPMVIVRRTQAT